MARYKISKSTFLNLAHLVSVVLKFLFGEACSSVKYRACLFKQLFHWGDVFSKHGSILNNPPKCFCIRSDGVDLGLISFSGSRILLKHQPAINCVQIQNHLGHWVVWVPENILRQRCIVVNFNFFTILTCHYVPFLIFNFVSQLVEVTLPGLVSPSSASWNSSLEGFRPEVSSCCTFSCSFRPVRI